MASPSSRRRLKRESARNNRKRVRRATAAAKIRAKLEASPCKCFNCGGAQFGCRLCCVVPLPEAPPGAADVDMTHLAIAITGVILLVRNGRLVLGLQARFKVRRPTRFQLFDFFREYSRLSIRAPISPMDNTRHTYQIWRAGWFRFGSGTAPVTRGAAQRPGKGVVGLREYLLADPARIIAALELLAYLDLGDVSLLQGYAFVARGGPPHAYPRDVDEALRAVHPVVKAVLDGRTSGSEVRGITELRRRGAVGRDWVSGAGGRRTQTPYYFVQVERG